MKNNNLVYGIIAAVLLIGAIVYLSNGGSFGTDGIPEGAGGTSGFYYLCYDNVVDLNPVDCDTGNPLAIVGGTPGIGAVTLVVTASNTGSIPLTCSPIETSPTMNTLDTTQKILPVDGTPIPWATAPIDMNNLVDIGPDVTFSAKVRCKYKSGTNIITVEPDQEKSIVLTIISDVVNAGFNVDFNAPDVGSVVCGDGTCQIPVENVINCVADCSV